MQERELGLDAVPDLPKCHSERAVHPKWPPIPLPLQGGCEGAAAARKSCRGLFQLRESEEVIDLTVPSKPPDSDLVGLCPHLPPAMA